LRKTFRVEGHKSACLIEVQEALPFDGENSVLVAPVRVLVEQGQIGDALFGLSFCVFTEMSKYRLVERVKYFIGRFCL
jgi:hypothetical protein